MSSSYFPSFLALKKDFEAKEKCIIVFNILK